MAKLFLLLVPVTIMAGISTGIVALSFDPFKVDGFVKFLFFASLSAFLWGCGAIVFFILNFLSNDRPADALRRGFFVAVLCLAIIFLKKYGLLFPYTGFATFVIILLIELWIYKRARIGFITPDNG